MGEGKTFRPDALDKQIWEKIRKHLRETVGEPSETQIVRFALRAADRELARKSKQK
jgi:hypothetical protein